MHHDTIPLADKQREAALLAGVQHALSLLAAIRCHATPLASTHHDTTPLADKQREAALLAGIQHALSLLAAI